MFYNCNQPGRLARDGRNPCTTCKYCHDTDHVIEDCPQLLAKMQERRNQGAQPNIPKIYAEIRTDDLKIQVVTRGGAAIGDNRGDIFAIGVTWVRKAEPKRPAFDPIQQSPNFQ